MITFFEKVNDLLAESVPFVTVTVVHTIGSVPNEIGSKMIVTKDGLFFGTVGGGKVETLAIREAQKLLIEGLSGDRSDDSRKNWFVDWSLNRDVGMTCGGSVKLYFEAFNTRLWHITVFGAGHCANALVKLLVNLDCRITCIDPRQEWLDKLPVSPKLKTLCLDDMPSHVLEIPAHSFVLMLTMGHSTDKPILLEILKMYPNISFPYIGVIGSKAKAARLVQDIKEAGLPNACRDLFYCPMGLPIGNNHPQEIAISIAAQLLEVRDSREKCVEDSGDATQDMAETIK